MIKRIDTRNIDTIVSNIIGDIKVNKKPRNLALTYNAKIGLESGYYMIINKKSGRALDAGEAGGNDAYIYPIPDLNNQWYLWEIRKVN